MAVLTHKSLAGQSHQLSATDKQLKLLQQTDLPSFQTKLKETGLFPLTTVDLDVFQINMGKMCNQVCKHCHVDAGPDRREIMTRETM